MYPLWRHHYEIAKMQDDEFYVRSKDLYGRYTPPYQLFNSKKEAIKLARAATKENFHSLYRLITYWIAMGLCFVVLFLSPFVIGKFINGGLMSLYIPYPVSGYIAGTIVTVASFGCLASKRFHSMLSRIDEEIRYFVLRD